MWWHYALLFISSACIMVLELVAGRLVAPFIGVSLYTWTGIIGACLTGMSLGNLFGGRLADRSDARTWLGRMFLVAAGFVALFLVAQPVVSFISRGVMYLQMPPLLGIFGLSMGLFGVPTFFIAAISPIVYRLALSQGTPPGGTVGRLAASGVAGSILGTYATGFWLIPTFGTQAIMVGVAICLAALGVIQYPWARSRKIAAAAAILLLPWPVARAVPFVARNICQVESAYYCIYVEVLDEGTGSGMVRRLRLDHLIHGGQRLEKPDEAYYPYEKVLMWIYQAGVRPDSRSLILGGGAYIIPRLLEAQFPQATVDVAEIDVEVTRTALREFTGDVRRTTSINTDARYALITMPPDQTYDLVLGDVFQDLSVPYHLATVEFARMVQSRLNPGGLYVMNVVDSLQGPFVGAMANTLRQVFPHVTVLPGADWSQRWTNRSPHLVVGSASPIPWTEWQQHPAKPDFDAAPLTLPTDGLVFTDNYVPTDNLLLSVFAERWRTRW